MENLFNVLSVSLIIVVVLGAYLGFLYIKQLKNRYRLLKHRHACEILEVDGPVPPLNYNRISELWVSYKFNGEYDRYTFKESVIKKFTAKVNAMGNIQSIVEFCLTFSETQRHHTLPDVDKAMIAQIYSEVCRQTETKVMLVAHHSYRKLYKMTKSPEKDKAMVEFGLLLDHSCIKNFFPLSKNILDIESKLLLQKAVAANKAKRKKPDDAPVIFMATDSGAQAEN